MCVSVVMYDVCIYHRLCMWLFMLMYACEVMYDVCMQGYVCTTAQVSAVMYGYMHV